MILAAGPPIYRGCIRADDGTAARILERVRHCGLAALAANGDPDRTGPHGGDRASAWHTRDPQMPNDLDDPRTVGWHCARQDAC
jgi:hypothetical protein